MMFWFYSVVFGTIGLGFGYIGWRLIAPMRYSKRQKRIAWIILAVCAVLPVSVFLMQINRMEPATHGILSWIGYITLGLFSLLLTFTLLRDIVWIVFLGTTKTIQIAQTFFSRGNGRSVVPDRSRRAFLIETTNLGILGIGGIITGYGIYEARRRPAEIEVMVPIANLPLDLDGFRIVQITDIHAGLTVEQPFVESVAEQVMRLSPDMIALTGDLADGSVRVLRQHVAPLVQLRAPFGKFFVTGNHEYYSGALSWIEEADRMGFTVLLNEHRLITKGRGNLLVAGVTDYTAGEFLNFHASNPRQALFGAPLSDYKILLAHQPRSLFDALPCGFDLQISGHTHGGQFFPWNLVAAVGQPYISGLHRHAHTWIYVSRGTGYWGPPVRIAARSEVTILVLKRIV